MRGSFGWKFAFGRERGGWRGRRGLGLGFWRRDDRCMIRWGLRRRRLGWLGWVGWLGWLGWLGCRLAVKNDILRGSSWGENETGCRDGGRQRAWGLRIEEGGREAERVREFVERGAWSGAGPRIAREGNGGREMAGGKWR